MLDLVAFVVMVTTVMALWSAAVLVWQKSRQQTPPGIAEIAISWQLPYRLRRAGDAGGGESICVKAASSAAAAPSSADPTAR